MAERERSLGQARMRAILDNIPHFAWVKDLDGRYVAANKAFARSIGRHPREVIGLTDGDIYPKAYAERMREGDLRVMGTGQSRMLEEELWELGGASWFETFKTPIHDEEGRLIGVAGMNRSVAEWRLIEESLRRTEELNRSLLAAISDIVVTLDAGGSLVSVSTSKPERMRAPADMLIGRNVRDLLPADTAYRILNTLDELLQSGGSRDCEFHLPLPGGEQYFEARVTRTGSDHALAILRDVTEGRKPGRDKDSQESMRQRMETSLQISEVEALLRGVVTRAGSMLLETPPGGRTRQETLRIIHKAGQALSRVRQLNHLPDTAENPQEQAATSRSQAR
jgi:PAS domain S-box-containing protein